MILYEVKVAYDRQGSEDAMRKVRELYLVEAINMSDAEKQVTDEITPYIFAGEMEMQHCRKVQYADIFNDPNAEKWYKGRVELIYIDNDKETRKTVSILAAANSVKEADHLIREKMAQQDFEIISIARTAICDFLRPVH